MDTRSDDDMRVLPKSVIASVSGPLIAARPWIFVVGLTGILSAVLSLFVILRMMDRSDASFPSRGVKYVMLTVQIGGAAFAFWIGALLIETARLLRRTEGSFDPGVFKRALQRLRVYFIVQGVLAALGFLAMLLALIVGGLAGLLNS